MGRDRSKAESAATALACVVILGAVALLVVAVTAGDGSTGTPRTTGDPPVASPTPGGAGAPAVYVGGDACTDDAEAADAGSAASPLCSLPAAGAAATPGSRILIASGTYDRLDLDGREPIPRGVSFEALDPKRPPTIQGLGVDRARDLRFDGLRFTADVTIVESYDIVVADSRFASSTAYVRQSRRVGLARNVISGVSGERRAVLIQGSPDPAKANQDITVKDNRIFDVDHDAIAVYNLHVRTKIIGNVISDVHQPDDFPFHSDAIQMTGGDDAVISRNIISEVTHGVLIKDLAPATRLRVTGNLITRTGGAGLQVFNAPGAVVSRNTIWGTAFGMTVNDDAAVKGRTSMVLRDNVLDQLIQNAKGGITSASGNVFRIGRSIGRPAYRGSPAFADARRGDLRIALSRSTALLPADRPAPGAQLRLP